MVMIIPLKIGEHALLLPNSKITHTKKITLIQNLIDTFTPILSWRPSAAENLSFSVWSKGNANSSFQKFVPFDHGGAWRAQSSSSELIYQTSQRVERPLLPAAVVSGAAHWAPPGGGGRRQKRAGEGGSVRASRGWSDQVSLWRGGLTEARRSSLTANRQQIMVTRLTQWLLYFQSTRFALCTLKIATSP